MLRYKMFSYFKKSKNQKKLYFQIDSEFKKSDYEDNKIPGIYAIFKDDLCLYVGQSKNIASRIATHLSGKYKECSKILIYPTVDPDDDLIELEKFVMQELEPTENLLIDFTEKLDHSLFAEGTIMYAIENPHHTFDILQDSEFTIINTKFDLFIECEMHLDLYDNYNVFDFLLENMKIVADAKSNK